MVLCRTSKQNGIKPGCQDTHQRTTCHERRSSPCASFQRSRRTEQSLSKIQQTSRDVPLQSRPPDQRLRRRETQRHLLSERQGRNQHPQESTTAHLPSTSNRNRLPTRETQPGECPLSPAERSS